MLNAPTNVRFRGKADVDQPMLTNLDLLSTRPSQPQAILFDLDVSSP
jgi:hypothetical protein